MKDRYLYRAKRTDNLEWVKGYLAQPHCTDTENGVESYYFNAIDKEGFHSQCIVSADTICQCTGAPGKNTKMIYENDIVKHEDGSIGIIKFGKYGVFHTGLYVEWVSETAMGYRNELGYWAPKVEVVGNIFDNLELLEVGE